MADAGRENEMVEFGLQPLRAVELSTRITDEEIPVKRLESELRARGSVDMFYI